MEYIKRKYQAALDLLTSYRKPAEICSKEVQWQSVYLELFLKIVTWKNIDITLKVFIFLQFVFWYSVVYNIKPICCIGVTLLQFIIFDAIFYEMILCKYTGQYTKVIEETVESLMSWLDLFKELRRENKLLFTIFMFINCLVCCVFSISLSGYQILYVLLLLTFFAPVVFRRWTPKGKQQKMLAEDELIPFIANKDFSSAVEAELESLLTDRTADSVSNSFASGISAMPSYTEIVDNDSIVLGEEDLIPRYFSVSRGQTPSDSDSDHKHDLSFESDHFKTSSSDEDIQELKADMSNTWLHNVANIGNALMSNLVNRTTTNNGEEEKEEIASSDSDFEILDTDEVIED